MHGLCLEGQRRWSHHFLPVIWLWVLVAAPPTVLGYFLGDSKAVLSGCGDHWILQDRAAMPLLFQMTVCIHIRVVVPGSWVAFSYSSARAPRPELGLEGDDGALYGWLLGVRHRFPLQLSPTHWHRVCLRRDVRGNSFSLEVDGEVVAERTVIAQAIPPSGSLRLGCRPRDRPPGAALAEVELYLFRMWADLDDHAACEEGSVIGWDSQFWGVTSARARQRDPNLPCEHRRVRRWARYWAHIKRIFVSLFGVPGRLYLTPRDALSRTTTTSSPVIATSLKHTLSQSQVTVSPMSEASGTRSTEQPTDDPAGISSQTEHPSVTPSLNSSVTTTTSTNATPPTTLSPVSRSTNSPAADGTPSYTAAMLSTTVPATTVTANRDPDHSPVSPVTSDHGATSDATSHPASSAPPSDASPTNQIPTSTQTSPITTLRANQTTPPKSLTTGSPLVNCDITRLCSNEHAYYWMFLSVKATGTNRTETDVHDWVSNVFSCDTEAVRATTAAHDADMMDLCQGGRKLQIVEVSCDANEDIRRANCSLLLQLSHAVSVCKLQHALQRAGDEPLQARLIGEVERVGRELCEDVEPSSGGFVRCTSSSSLGDICQSDTHSGLTCSFIELGSTPLPQPERESCSWEEPRFCDCTAFCRDTRQFFALSINISSPTVDVNFIESMLSKLGIAPACDTMSESLCTNYVEVSRRYQGAHLECHGTKQRLYSCMVILEMSGPVDVCSLANFLQRHMDNSSGITNDEPLTRMAVCGPPGLPANDLLASNLTWVASNLLHSEICQPDHTLKCDGNETFAVLLTDSCQDPPEPLPTNPSTLQPSPLSNNNTTTASETTPPSPANTTQQNNTTAENNAATQPKNASEGTVAQPNATAQLNSTQTSTAPSVLQASTQNTTTTATPLLTTLYFSTTATTQNTTHYNVTVNATLPTISPRTDNTVNTTLFPTFWLNTTLPNITTEAYTTAVPLNTTNSARTNTTQHNTTAIQPSTTQLGIWESNSTHPNTTAWPVYTEQSNATQHSTLAADSGAVYNTTTTSATTPQKTTPRSDNTTSFVSTVSPSVPTIDNTTDFMGKTTLRPNVTVSNSTTAHNTTASGIPTLSTPTHSAKPHNTTNNTTPFTTINPVNLTLFNTTTPSLPPADNRTSQNTTVTPSDTTLNTTTLTPSYTTVYNETATNNGKLQNRTVTASNATINTTTTSPSYTTADNITTAANNQTLLNITTPPANTTLNTTTTSPSYTTADNITTPANNRTILNITASPANTTLNTTTLSLNNTSDNITTAANNRTLLNITTPPANTTLNATTLSLNNTSDNITTAANNRTLLNITTPPANTTLNATTLSLNNTSDNITTAANNRTLLNITTPPPNTTMHITTLSLNNTTPDNVTTATTGQTQQNTTVTATPGNETLYNAITSPDNSALGNATSTVGNTTVNITTIAPRDIPANNQTTNYTTVSVPYNVTTPTTRNDTNSTTATPANSVTPVSSNTTTETDLLYSAATSVNPDFNQTTKGPGFNLTTAAPANTSLEPTAAASTMTATARHTTTIPGPLPGQTSQTNSTTTEVFLPAGETAPFQTDTPTTQITTTTVAQETTKNSQEEEEEAAAELLDQTQDASQLNASQVEQVVGSLEKLLEGPTVSQSVGQTAINVISNLMEGDALALAASANRLIRAVDDLGFKLVVADESEVLSSNSLLVAVRTVDGTNFPAASINIFNTADLQLNVLGRSRSRSRSSQTALGSVYLPSSLTEGLSPEEQRQASRVQFTFYTTTSLFQDAALDNQTIVSPVLGSSVANLSISNLRENIQFTIQNINPLPANYVASCAFWDFSLNGGGGGWNSAGCFLLNTTQENTSCSCNHLTSFAILLDVSRGEGTNPQHALILTFITYIGCGISAIFLAVTLFTYICFQKLLRDIPSKILVQLCMSLFLLNLLFLLDGWLALYPSTGLCISTAFFLHYFLLTSFTWAGLEALHMYLSIIRVFTPYLSRYMLKFSLLGWGVPLIVVIVVISVDKNNYGLVTYGKNTNGSSDDFCWLRNDIAFYVGVVAYFILIFALTLLVFIVVLVQLARIKRQNPQNQSPQRGLMTDLRSIAGLVILLGLTWGFALFAWGPLYLPFIYLFSIFNSLQGFFIFVFHCAVKENVRRQWRTYLCCGRLRLAENSEWSRTATQNPKKLSVTTATSSALNPASRSSSVISEDTNSSGSVFGDSGISDGGSNSDVVLNEIHRRNAALQDMA